MLDTALCVLIISYCKTTTHKLQIIYYPFKDMQPNALANKHTLYLFVLHFIGKSGATDSDMIEYS
jgi:hypothetical protein